MNISLSAFVPENLVSRDRFGSPIPRQPAHLHIQAESGAYLRDSSRVPQRRPFIHLDYRWRSQPRVRRQGARKPQGSSERVLPPRHHVFVLCFLPIHSGHQVRYWTYQPGSHRRKVTQDFSSTFFLWCVP